MKHETYGYYNTAYNYFSMASNWLRDICLNKITRI